MSENLYNYINKKLFDKFKLIQIQMKHLKLIIHFFLLFQN